MDTLQHVTNKNLHLTYDDIIAETFLSHGTMPRPVLYSIVDDKFVG